MFGSQHAAATDIGLKRDNNEDAFFTNSRLGLWVVADGMGGHAAGEVASAIAINTIHTEIRAGKSLAEAIKRAHQAIIDATQQGIGAPGMGSTVVALQNLPTHYQIAWVGDSRAYLYQTNNDHSEEEFRQLTTDHSYVQMLYQKGAITEAELHTHPERNIITQCLGSMDLNHIQIDTIIGEWQPSSRLLLCSDGLSDVVAEPTMKAILASRISNQQCCTRLIQAALDGGGKDNITAAVISPPSRFNRWLQRQFTRRFTDNS